MSLLLNGELCASMRWTATWTGVWVAEVDMLPSSSADVVPSGRVAITTASGVALSGTVDAEHSGAFADRRHVRVIGGAAGWGKEVRGQHYNRAPALDLREVLTTTAAEVGESVLLLAPKAIGSDYVREAGSPASQVLTDSRLDWWVGADGVTRVGKRPEIPAASPLRILDWDPHANTLRFSAEVLVEPGTVIVDQRFGRRIVTKVEALIADATVTGTLYVAESAPAPGTSSELVEAIGAMARDATDIEKRIFYEYVVDALRGDQVELVAVTKTMPNLIPVNVWAGASGYRAKLRPGTRVLVGFREDGSPFVAFYEPPNDGGWRPLEVEIDASGKVTVGGAAASVVLGVESASRPVARVTPQFAAWITAVTGYINGLVPGTAIAPTDIASAKVKAS